MSGGSGGGGTQVVEQRSIPEWMQPYYENVLIPAATQEFMGGQYTPYLGDRVAEFTHAQELGHERTKWMEKPMALSHAGFLFDKYGEVVQNQTYDPTKFRTQYTPTSYDSGYNAGTINSNYYAGQHVPGYQASPITTGYEAGQIESGYDAGSFTPEVAAQMMNPYMQNVLDVERSKAIEAYEKGRAGTAAEAVKAGAFGGSRFGVREAEAQRGLESQLAEIQSKGMQQAYEQARQQFSVEEAARQQAGQMGLTAQQQTELARQRQEEFGMTAQQQTELARQRQEEFAMTAQQQNELARQRESELRMQGQTAQESALQQEEALRAQAAQMTDSSQQFAANLAQQVQSSQEAANQFAANYGQQNVQLALDVGQAQQRLGEAEQAMELARNEALLAVGREQQMLAQAKLDQAYADFRNAEDYNRNQIASFAAILGGTPVPVSSETYSTGSTSPAAQLLGGVTGLAGLAAYQGMG